MRKLTIKIFEEDGEILAECNDISSLGIGKTEEEALYELCEVIRTQIEICKEHGIKIWNNNE